MPISPPHEIAWVVIYPHRNDVVHQLLICQLHYHANLSRRSFVEI